MTVLKLIDVDTDGPILLNTNSIVSVEVGTYEDEEKDESGLGLGNEVVECSLIHYAVGNELWEVYVKETVDEIFDILANR